MAGDGMDMMDLLHAAQLYFDDDGTGTSTFVAPAPARLILATASKQLVKAFNHCESEHRKTHRLTVAKKDRLVRD